MTHINDGIIVPTEYLQKWAEAWNTYLDNLDERPILFEQLYEIVLAAAWESTAEIAPEDAMRYGNGSLPSPRHNFGNYLMVNIHSHVMWKPSERSQDLINKPWAALVLAVRERQRLYDEAEGVPEEPEGLEPFVITDSHYAHHYLTDDRFAAKLLPSLYLVKALGEAYDRVDVDEAQSRWGDLKEAARHVKLPKWIERLYGEDELPPIDRYAKRKFSEQAAAFARLHSIERAVFEPGTFTHDSVRILNGQWAELVLQTRREAQLAAVGEEPAEEFTLREDERNTGRPGGGDIFR